MAAGGIHDHLGGGFHRYSEDAEWHVPHFEKMLYDKAQLATIVSRRLPGQRGSVHADVARDILDYVLRDMTHPGWRLLFRRRRRQPSRCARTETTAEGAFYVWTQDEIRRLLGADADLFRLSLRHRNKRQCARRSGLSVGAGG